jgi:hypothetical protein
MMRDYDIEYDSILECYTLHYVGEVICLGADTLSDAEIEAKAIVEEWIA